MRRKVVLRPVIKEFSDCLRCEYALPWKYNLIGCRFRVTPQCNCMESKIQCINFKSKEL